VEKGQKHVNHIGQSLRPNGEPRHRRATAVDIHADLVGDAMHDLDELEKGEENRLIL
jgi:hypothetical protein